MKKIIFISLAVFFLFGLASPVLADNDEKVDLYFFYGDTCPHCKEAEAFLNSLGEKYPELEIYSYEVFNNKKNAELLLEFFENRNKEKVVRVPAIFIGEEVIVGYLNDAVTGQQIEDAIQEKATAGLIIDYPLIGKIDLSKLSLPVLTVVVGALDGFNPCAMWILLFLLALLINVRSRKRIWLVGGTFILTSGVIYFLLLSAWLNLFLAIGYVGLIRIGIGILAVCLGIWQIRNFMTYQPGVCKIAPDGSKLSQKLLEKAKQVVQSTALPATLIGVIILALGVNLVEFFCSAGLPAIYTNILALSNLSSSSYYLYLLLYTVVFMLDDMVVFLIAVFTLSKLGIGEKYSKWTTLIGGLLILILGILLIFKPELLMFV